MLCPNCQYDRRSLAAGAPCPECNAAAPEPTVYHGLPEGRLAWLRRVLLWTGASLGAMQALAVVSVVWAAQRPMSSDWLSDVLPLLWLGAVAAALPACVLLGWLRLARANGRAVRCRWGAVLLGPVAAITLLEVARDVHPSMRDVLWPVLRAVRQVRWVDMPAVLMGVGGLAGLAWHAARAVEAAGRPEGGAGAAKWERIGERVRRAVVANLVIGLVVGVLFFVITLDLQEDGVRLASLLILSLSFGVLGAAGVLGWRAVRGVKGENA
ncbi:MAG: hypothetical protein LW650_03210 [Planctomycetaceae bacterium]|nr:hypothetical protein [Phycisphaerales bacterium]MCE2652525.1 hypothetical protein [Planctomycetaceae bacterium]